MGQEARPSFEKLKWAEVRLKDGTKFKEVTVSGMSGQGVWFAMPGRKELVDFNLLLEPQKTLIMKAFIDMENWRKANPLKVSDGTKIEAMRRGEEEMLAKLKAGNQGMLWVGGQGLKVLEVRNETPVGATLLHAAGIANIKFADLSREDQEAFGYEPMLANRWPYLTAEEKAREQAAWFERRRAKREAEQKTKGRE